MRTEDAEELAGLWMAAHGEVAAFIRGLVGADESQDLLQQVAVKLVRHFDSYDRSKRFVPWAIGIAKHEVLAWRRRQATDRHLFTDEIIASVANAFARTANEELPTAEALRTCLETVTGRSRQALDLHYGDGLKLVDIAQRLGMTEGALRVLLCRARDAIRRCIEFRLRTQHNA